MRGRRFLLTRRRPSATSSVAPRDCRWALHLAGDPVHRPHRLHRIIARPPSPRTASPRRCRRGSRWPRRTPRPGSGRARATIDSSIWVAVITGFPWRLASRMICFCISGTSSNGSSTPRSPRATMIGVGGVEDRAQVVERGVLLDLGDQLGARRAPGGGAAPCPPAGGRTRARCSPPRAPPPRDVLAVLLGQRRRAHFAPREGSSPCAP